MVFKTLPLRTALISGLLLSSMSAFADGFYDPEYNGADDPQEVVNIPNTRVKWQSIGNCWAYATHGWAEALVLRDRGITENFSETYHTFRHYQEQLLSGGARSELQTGGSWYTSIRLLERYGFINEGDFVPGEADDTFSRVQSAATDYLNRSLKSGPLSRSRSAATVKAELNAAFGVNIDSLTSKIRYLNTIPLRRDSSGRIVTLADEARSWRETSLGQSLSTRSKDTLTKPVSISTSTLDRVKRALNDRQPVVMSWFVDFNALDGRGIFSSEQLNRVGRVGSQGFHMTVIEDYVVEYRDPRTGKVRELEGEVSADLKEWALQYGKIKAFIVKNSWGGDERLNRASYRHTDGSGSGYHRLEASYLFSAIQNADDNGWSNYNLVTNSFALPPGY